MRIKFGIIAVGMLLLIGMDAIYAQFVQNSSRSLFSDVKAFKVGDAIMVLIMEDTQADNGATTNQNRSTDLSGSATASGGSSSSPLGSVGINTGNNFKAQGNTGRTESIRSRLSARVTEVEQNGNLKIEGKRTTQVNGETQTIVIRGVVRPVDVTPGNSIYSYNILDLTLLIEGKGSVTETQEPGLITKFLKILF